MDSTLNPGVHPETSLVSIYLVVIALVSGKGLDFWSLSPVDSGVHLGSHRGVQANLLSLFSYLWNRWPRGKPPVDSKIQMKSTLESRLSICFK